MSRTLPVTFNKDLFEGGVMIEVTQDHINLARRNYNRKGWCPVHYAVNSKLIGFTVKVLRTSIQVFPDKGNKGMYAKMSWELVEFGETWDADQSSVRPMKALVDFKI